MGSTKMAAHFLGRKRGLEELVLDEAGAAERERVRLLRAAFAAAVDVGIADVRDAWNQRREAALLLRLRRGE